MPGVRLVQKWSKVGVTPKEAMVGKKGVEEKGNVKKTKFEIKKDGIFEKEEDGIEEKGVVKKNRS